MPYNNLNLLYSEPSTMTKDRLLTYRFRRTLTEAWPMDQASTCSVYRGDVLGKSLYRPKSLFSVFLSSIARAVGVS